MDPTSARRGSSEARFDEADCGPMRRGLTPAETIEVRWFVRGSPPRRLWRPDRRPRTRVDAYHDQSLRLSFSLKRRGESGPWECKHRVEEAHVVVLGDVVVAETWTKERPQRIDPAASSWISVSKRIWHRADIEVVDLRVEEEPWWSLALKLRPSLPAFGALERLVGLAASGGFSGSYPAWLIERRPVIVALDADA